MAGPTWFTPGTAGAHDPLPTGRWPRARKEDLRRAHALHELGSLAIADLSGKGRKDLVMLGRQEIAIFRQQADGTLGTPDRLPLADENCYGLQICDVNGDGRPDLVYSRPRQSRHPAGAVAERGRPVRAGAGVSAQPASSTLQVLRPAGPMARRNSSMPGSARASWSFSASIPRRRTTRRSRCGRASSRPRRRPPSRRPRPTPSAISMATARKTWR